MTDALAAGVSVQEKQVGQISGFSVHMSVRLADQTASWAIRFSKDETENAGSSDDPIGRLRRLEMVLATARAMPANSKHAADAARTEQAKSEGSLPDLRSFQDSEKLAKYKADFKELQDTFRAEAKAKAAAPPVPLPSEKELRNPLGPTDFRTIAVDLNAELARTGLTGKVSARLVRGLADGGGLSIQGRQRGAAIKGNPAAPVWRSWRHAARDHPCSARRGDLGQTARPVHRNGMAHLCLRRAGRHFRAE